MEKLDLSPLRSAIIALEDSLGVVAGQRWFNDQSLAVQNTLISGVIQNFECVYELSVKMLRRQLEKDASSPSEIDQSDFRDLLRTAAEKGLVADVEAWFTYRKMRYMTAYSYDREIAQQIYNDVSPFIHSVRVLLGALGIAVAAQLLRGIN